MGSLDFILDTEQGIILNACKPVAFLLPILLSAAAYAKTNDIPPLDNAFVTMTETEQIVKLPFNGMNAVEHEGQIVFLSKNGRFAIFGQMVDLWNEKELTSLKDIEDSVSRISIENIGIESLNTITLGNGEQPVVIFVDPMCDFCMDLIGKLRDIERQHPEQYTFHIVVVSALGEDSHQMAKALFCAKDKTHAVEHLLSKQLLDLAQDETCQSSGYDTTLIMADMLEIQGVPFLIAPDGRFHTGIPDDVAAWLATKTE